jgi:acyl-CoA synthetase (AMP-forming)/AMP-acid ligase II
MVSNPLKTRAGDRFNNHHQRGFISTMMNESEHYTVEDLIFNRNQDPDHNAIESPGLSPLTYRDLRIQIIYVIKMLNAMGFHRNDRIAVITPAGPETAVIIVAVMAGFTSIPLNPQNKKQEYERYFSQLKLKAIIVQKGYDTAATMVATSRNIPVIELVPVSSMAGKFTLMPVISPETDTAEFAISSDIAYVLLTSGTTATSKIVPVSQKQSAISKQRMCIASGMTAVDRCLHVVPYHHGTGIGYSLLALLLTGGTVICTRDFIPSDFLHLLRTYRPTYYAASPALHAGILREIKKRPSDEFSTNSLRYIQTDSGFLPQYVREELESLLNVPVIDAYGMSEAGSLAINIPPKKGSVGIPFIDSVQIVNENGLPLKPNTTGEIIIKGETIFSGYEDAPDENEAAFVNGWFRTGDMGYLDDEGYLFLTGRKKELINKGGEKVSPVEIDTALKSHPFVREAMTFPVHDPVLGEDIAAMVVVADEKLTEADLRMYLLDRLVQFKLPRRIYFVDEIPRNPAGKPLRHAGTARYSQRLSYQTE